MPEVIEQLLHRRIKKAERIHDYAQIYFDDGAVLNIFNSLSVTGGEFADLTGSEVIGVNSGEVAINLLLSNGRSVRVGMTDDDYQGPEAMEYITADGTRIVWP